MGVEGRGRERKKEKERGKWREEDEEGGRETRRGEERKRQRHQGQEDTPFKGTPPVTYFLQLVSTS
jgi:hypothetical protein